MHVHIYIHLCTLSSFWSQKTQVCDLRDVTKILVHPTRSRVFGFLLNDKFSHKRMFLCFKLCRKANLKVIQMHTSCIKNTLVMFQGHEFKKLHEKRLKLFHPQPNLIRVSYMFTHALRIFQATQKCV